MAGRDVDYDRPILLGCGRCDVQWTALTAAHCPGCHETFAGVGTGFDAHRVDGRCVPPAQVGLRLDGGYWVAAGERAPGKILRAPHHSGIRQAG
ncbi:MULTISPECIES: hypothetical protein [Protofrankia]|uniref:Phage FDXHR zinc binding domain-containing protein n=2 Tax=Protofrankia TaxID=2994361 RepID=F8B5C1_9ACTN|nr:MULTISPECIES: hypothetical protein [Protofrankia]AEH07973.1 hypothetical protein FsymDg_0416 [Candidatus Protofrankia datiscae]KLL10168.1 hypothetical protein FrCorBMG51_19870 [Protofrankia coriariae]ONH37517.1 hypothetical protein BL254_03440 [Protofrankia sp. BMG5.30]